MLLQDPPFWRWRGSSALLLGVALLVVVLGSSEALSHSGFELVWLLAIGSALLTGAAAAFIPESQPLLPRSTRGRQLVTSH